MSRIGRKPIDIPAGVDVVIEGKKVTAKGPNGELSGVFADVLGIERVDNEILVTRPTDEPVHRSLHGLTRSLINNMVVGVSTGFNKTLEIVGVGYRAAKKGEGIEIAAGYSHPVIIDPIKGINFEVPIPTRIVVSGADKQMVGEVAAKIRAVRKPEPYKGKGIKYQDEKIRRKVGKTAK
ncbi:MAG: 50S ribosomal protein L6 [Actinomycetota bacterium]|nr:50S ribosomal protein L6 [Actinomycetota bacterium]